MRGIWADYWPEDQLKFEFFLRELILYLKEQNIELFITKFEDKKPIPEKHIPISKVIEWAMLQSFIPKGGKK